MRKLRGVGNILLTNGTISKSPVLVHWGVCAEEAVTTETARSRPKRVMRVRLFLTSLFHACCGGRKPKTHSVIRFGMSHTLPFVAAGRKCKRAPDQIDCYETRIGK